MYRHKISYCTQCTCLPNRRCISRPFSEQHTLPLRHLRKVRLCSLAIQAQHAHMHAHTAKKVGLLANMCLYIVTVTHAPHYVRTCIETYTIFPTLSMSHVHSSRLIHTSAKLANNLHHGPMHLTDAGYKGTERSLVSFEISKTLST